MMPMVMKLTRYTAYAGQSARSDATRSALPTGTRSSRIRSVAAMANTPSQNASSRLVRIAVLADDEGRGGLQSPAVDEVGDDPDDHGRDARDTEARGKESRREEPRRVRVLVVHVHVDDDAEVVERGEHRVQRDGDGEPDEARVEDGLEDEHLRHEADRRRDAGERDEEHRER